MATRKKAKKNEKLLWTILGVGFVGGFILMAIFAS